MLSLSSLLATVAIAVTPPHPPPDGAEIDPEPAVSPLPSAPDQDNAEAYLQGVLASCRTALGEGKCVTAEDPSVPSRAHVLFLPEAVEVTLKHDGGTVERRLAFGPSDSIRQRQVAAGLLVAAMTAAVEHEQHRPSAAPPQEKEPPRSAPAELPPSTPEKRSELSSPGVSFLDIAGSLEVSLDGAQWSGGGLLGGRMGLTSPWGANWEVAGSYSTAKELELGMVQLMAGPSVSLLGRRSLLQWFLGAGIQGQGMQIWDRQGGGRSGILLRGGLRVETSLSLNLPGLSPVVGLSLAALVPRLEVRRNEETVLAPHPLSIGTFFGVRWAPHRS